MGNNETAAILAASAAQVVSDPEIGIVSIRHGGVMLFKVVAGTGASKAGEMVAWVRQTTGSLMVEDVYVAALEIGFGSKADLVVQVADGSKCFDELISPDSRLDDFRVFLDPWRHPLLEQEGSFLVEVVDLLPESEVLERCKALGYTSIEECDRHQRFLAKSGSHEYTRWVLSVGKTMVRKAGSIAMGAFQFQKGLGRRAVFPNGQLAEIDAQGNFKTLLLVSKYERATLYENVSAEEGQHNFDWECSVKATGSGQVAHARTQIVGQFDEDFDLVLFEGNVKALPHRIIEPDAIINPCH